MRLLAGGCGLPCNPVAGVPCRSGCSAEGLVKRAAARGNGEGEWAVGAVRQTVGLTRSRGAENVNARGLRSAVQVASRGRESAGVNTGCDCWLAGSGPCHIVACRDATSMLVRGRRLVSRGADKKNGDGEWAVRAVRLGLGKGARGFWCCVPVTVVWGLCWLCGLCRLCFSAPGSWLWCVPVAGGVSPLPVVCPRCRWCVPAAGGVSPLLVVCPRCWWCVPAAQVAECGNGVWSFGGWQFPGLCGSAGVCAGSGDRRAGGIGILGWCAEWMGRIAGKALSL